MRRLVSFSIHTPIATSLACNRGFNHGAVEHFFSVLREVLSTAEFTAHSIWNCDATVFTTVANVGKVMAITGVRQVRNMSSAERDSNITALCCIMHESCWLLHSATLCFYASG